jgi:hypothetical protein
MKWIIIIVYSISFKGRNVECELTLVVPPGHCPLYDRVRHCVIMVFTATKPTESVK